MCEAGRVRAMMAAVVRMTMVFLVFSWWRAATVFHGFQIRLGGWFTQAVAVFKLYNVKVRQCCPRGWLFSQQSHIGNVPVRIVPNLP